MTAIASHDEMEQALEQLGRLYRSLAGPRRQIEPTNARTFAVLAEGHAREIRRLQTALDEYAGVDPARTEGALSAREAQS